MRAEALSAELWESEIEQVQLCPPASPWTFGCCCESKKLAIQQLNRSGGMHLGEAGQLQLKGVLVEGVRDMVPGPGNRIVNELACRV